MKNFKKTFAFTLAAMLVLGTAPVFGTVSNNHINEPNLPLGQTALTTGEIIVNGVDILAPRPSVTGGVIMLPLRPIAEKLGFDLFWDQSERRVDIKHNAGTEYNYVIWIGQAKFSSDGGLTTREFGPAPEIIDGLTFVPISIFNYGFTGYSAKIEAGKVIINTLDKITAPRKTENNDVEKVFPNLRPVTIQYGHAGI